jgi:polyketide synthase 12
MLESAVTLADTGGAAVTGSLSLEADPWLGDHAVLGTVLLPGTGLVELALQAAARVGCEHLAELVLETPLVLPEHGRVSLQVSIGPADESGNRSIAIYSRPPQAADDLAWTRHGTGVVAAAQTAASTLAEWPPGDAAAVDLSDAYQRLLVRGYEYGPVFRGLRKAWRRGSEVLAEVSLPPEAAADAASYGIHPALLDAALHPFVLDLHDDTAPGAHADADTAAATRLPFAWRGVQVHSAGTQTVRVRLRPAGQDAMSVDVWDTSGTPVASVASLAVRPVSTQQLHSAAGAATGADAWRYQVVWEPWESPDAAPLPGTWLAVTPQEPGAAAAAREYLPALEESGARLVRLDVPSAISREALAARLAELAVSPGQFAGVVSFLGLDESGLPGAPGLTAGIAGSLTLIQALGDASVRAPLWCFTRGAVVADDDDPRISPGQAMLWGLGMAAALEHPDRWGGLIDLPEALDDKSGGYLAAVLAAQGPEDQVALRPGGVFRRRLAPANTGAPARKQVPPGAVLITGGTGGLGTQVARWAARRGAPAVVLLSRRGPAADGTGALQAELAPLGTRVLALAADIGDRDSLAEALRRLRAEGITITAVVHAAGITADAPLHELRITDLARVAAVKAEGARLLAELLEDGTEETPLDEFIVFSSIAGIWGSGGQAAYSAANAYLDAFICQRRGRGRNGTALAWGPWAGGGMVTPEFEPWHPTSHSAR